MPGEKLVTAMVRSIYRQFNFVGNNVATEAAGPSSALRTLNKEKLQNGIPEKINISNTSNHLASGCEYGQDKPVTAAALNPTQDLVDFVKPSAASSQPIINNKQTQKIVNRYVKKLQRYFASFDNQDEEATAVKPYSRIPGPKGLPLLGSALQYTALGKFSPKEYHKALEYNHNK